MFTYKIKEENEDFTKSIIEKGNITVDFTITDMDKEQEALSKYLKEFRANQTVKKTTIENIEEFHPFVKDFNKQQLFTIALYQEAKNAFEQYEEKIQEFEKQLSESRSETLEILRQVGISKTQIESISTKEESDEKDNG